MTSEVSVRDMMVDVDENFRKLFLQRLSHTGKISAIHCDHQRFGSFDLTLAVEGRIPHEAFQGSGNRIRIDRTGVDAPASKDSGQTNLRTNAVPIRSAVPQNNNALP